MRLLAFALLVACSGKQTSTTTEPGPGSSAPPPVAIPAGAIQCKADTDCPNPLACGPCKSGEILTSTNTHPECVVNPCGKSIHSHCAAGVCQVD
jgi:hypothetical protein